MIEIFTDRIIWSFLPVIILLMVFYVLIRLVLRKQEENEILWAKLELIWVFVGLIGVLSVVNKDRLEYQMNNANLTKSRIEDYSNRVFNSLNLQIPCHQYDKEFVTLSDTLSQSEINEICVWKSQLSKDIFSHEYSNLIDVTPNSIQVILPRTKYYFNRLEKSILTYNAAVKEIIILKKWRFFKESLGFLMVIFAFALRLVIGRRKIRKMIYNKEE